MQIILDPRLLRFCNSRLTLKNLLNFPNCTFPLVDKHSPNGQMVFLFGSIGCFWRFWWHCFYLLSFSSEIRLFIFTGLCHVSCLHVTMSLWHPYFPYNLYKLYIGFKRNEMGRKLFRHKLCPCQLLGQHDHDIQCQMSVSGVSVVAPRMFVWHCVSVGHPAPYLSRSHPPVSGPGVMPSNIVPTAITSELELP